ncbi:hypothetical protein [Maribacter sp. 2304DJ31-5]|uniref:hypothetical protein n=1 Tax=Maribacter sp. 2304DJ31-5 TaxID=3386273 RepID=UPI0039BCE6FD
MKIKNYLKALSIFHMSLVVGLCIFLAFAVSQVKSFNTDTSEQHILLYMVPVFALLGYFGSQFFFKKMISGIKIMDALEEKLKKFQSASHIKYVLIEVPAFLALFTYYNSGNALPLLIALCLLAYLFVQKPSRGKVLKELPLTADEKQQLK